MNNQDAIKKLVESSAHATSGLEAKAYAEAAVTIAHLSEKGLASAIADRVGGKAW